MKERLLFVSRKWPPAIGGMETYSVDLAASLEAHFDVTRLVLPGNANGRPPALAAYARFVLRAAIYVLLRARHYQHLVIADLVLFPLAVVSKLVAPRQTRAVVLYGLDLVYQQRTGLLPRLYGVYLSAFRHCQRIFAAIVAISAYTRSLATAAGLSRVTIINPCLPDSPLTRANPDSSPLPPSFAQSAQRILYFGRLVPRKGADWFAAEVLPKLPLSAEFFVVGTPTDPAYLRRLLQRPRTHYLGPQPSESLAALITNADLVVMPNIPTPASRDVEGFGLVALEAASLGAVLVASRLQGITDAVIDGETGILIEAGDTTAWAEAATALLVESATERDMRRRSAATASRQAFSREKLGTAFARAITGTTTRDDAWI